MSGTFKKHWQAEIKKNQALERKLEEANDKNTWIKKQQESWNSTSKETIKALERQLEKARENIYKYAEIALMEGKDEFGYSWEDFKHFVLDEQLKEQGDE